MLTHRLVLISSALMLTLPPAIGDEIRRFDAPPVILRAQPDNAAAGGTEAMPASESGEVRAEAGPRVEDGRERWHWTFDGQSPSIGHRMGEGGGVMRFHGIRNGAGVLFEWSF